MDNRIKKHIEEICKIANAPILPSADFATEKYISAYEFAQNYTADSPTDEEDINRLKKMLQDFSLEFGITKDGVKSDYSLDRYIQRLEELSEMDEDDIDDIYELENEIVEMRDEMDMLKEVVLVNKEGYIPRYTNLLVEKYEKLLKTVSENFGFCDSDDMFDMMFPNRDDNDDDDFDVNDFFDRD